MWLYLFVLGQVTLGQDSTVVELNSAVLKFGSMLIGHPWKIRLQVFSLFISLPYPALLCPTLPHVIVKWHEMFKESESEQDREAKTHSDDNSSVGFAHKSKDHQEAIQFH